MLQWSENPALYSPISDASSEGTDTVPTSPNYPSEPLDLSQPVMESDEPKCYRCGGNECQLSIGTMVNPEWGFLHMLQTDGGEIIDGGCCVKAIKADSRTDNACYIPML